MAKHTNSSISPLLRLPGEIRNEIYQYVLDESLYKFSGGTALRNAEFKQPLALLRVCREIYKETRLLPFSLNTFVFHGFSAFRKFIVNYSTASQRQAIRAVSISICISCCFNNMIELENRQFHSLSDVLPGLRSVRVTEFGWDCGFSANFEERQKKIEQWLRCGLDERVALEFSFIETWSDIL